MILVIKAKNGKILAIFCPETAKIEKCQGQPKPFIDASIRNDDLSESYDEPRDSFEEIGKNGLKWLK